MKDYAKHALWIYGVIVGLAFRESVLDLFTHSRIAGKSHEILEGMRFLLFFFIATTFYLGAAHFFEDVHGPGADANYAANRKSFGADFIMGLIHFTFFIGWSLSLFDHTNDWIFGLTPSLAWMSVVLLYDIIWCTLGDSLARVPR